MTLPAERAAALNRVRKFLYELADPRVYPKLPKHIRHEALGALKHYPYECEVQMLTKGINIFIDEEKLEQGEPDGRD